MDKRRKMICVLDTETIGVDKPLVYDLGISIVDKQGRIYGQANWIIKEVFYDSLLMNSAYYGWKVPIYEEMIERGECKVVTWKQAIAEMNAMLDEYNVSAIAAYNMGFDKRALTFSQDKLTKTITKVLRRKVEVWDIWGMACQTILKQKTYQRLAKSEGWVSPAGNIKTNAEVAYRYLTNKLGFIESHTALHDTEIETAILAKCLRQHKKMDKGILAHPWRLAQSC